MDLERTLLAMECAESLGIKALPPVLQNFMVKYSEIPREDGVIQRYSEQSLLAMGVVQSYGSTFVFVDTAGNTCLLPYSEVIKQELEKCGYVICEYGSPTVDFGYQFDKNGLIDMWAPGYWEATEKEAKMRAQATLPPELAQKVMRQEQKNNIQQYMDSYAYDVFDAKLYRGHQFGATEQESIVETLGYDNPVARRFMALTGWVCQSLSSSTRSATDIKSFLMFANSHTILNNSIYFGQGGIYEQINPQKVK